MPNVAVNVFRAATTNRSGYGRVFNPVAATNLVAPFNNHIVGYAYNSCLVDGATCYAYVIAASQLADGITNGGIRVVGTACGGYIGAGWGYISKIAVGCAYIYHTSAGRSRTATVIIGNTNGISSGGGGGSPGKTGTTARCRTSARCCPCIRGYVYRRSCIGRLQCAKGYCLPGQYCAATHSTLYSRRYIARTIGPTGLVGVTSRSGEGISNRINRRNSRVAAKI